MTPYIIGTAARKTERSMDYDPINFKRMQLVPGSCYVRVLRDNSNNALFELICGSSVMMAFLFSGLRPWELNQKRDAFSRLFEAGKKEDSVVYYSVLPTLTVEDFPIYPMQSIRSVLGESGFWACDGLHLSVHSTSSKTAVISISQEDGIHLASFEIAGYESDDSEVLDAAMELRKRLGMKHPIRIETVWEHEKLVWFHPANHISHS